MTVRDIVNQLPTHGKSHSDVKPGGTEDWVDHALEKIILEANNENNLFKKGAVMAMQSMFISLTLDEAPWRMIREAMSAVCDEIVE